MKLIDFCFHLFNLDLQLFFVVLSKIIAINSLILIIILLSRLTFSRRWLLALKIIIVNLTFFNLYIIF